MRCRQAAEQADGMKSLLAHKLLDSRYYLTGWIILFCFLSVSLLATDDRFVAFPGKSALAQSFSQVRVQALHCAKPFCAPSQSAVNLTTDPYRVFCTASSVAALSYGSFHVRCVELSKFFATYAPHISFVIDETGDERSDWFNVTITVKGAKSSYPTNYGHNRGLG